MKPLQFGWLSFSVGLVCRCSARVDEEGAQEGPDAPLCMLFAVVPLRPVHGRSVSADRTCQGHIFFILRVHIDVRVRFCECVVRTGDTTGLVGDSTDGSEPQRPNPRWLIY